MSKTAPVELFSQSTVKRTEEASSCRSGPHGCMGCIMGNPCAACLARMDNAETKGHKESGYDC